MINQIVFWTLAGLYTLFSLPFVVLGFLYNGAREEFNNGQRKHRAFTYWMTKLWKKINPYYYTPKK